MTNIFSFISLTFGRVLQFLLVFLTIKVMTTLLSPEDVGQYYLILAIISGFLFLFINPLGLFINRRINSWKNSSLIRQYIYVYIFYIFIIAIISLIISFLFLEALINVNVSYFWIAALIGTSIFFNTINTTVIPSLNLLGHPLKYVTLIILTVLFSLVFATMFVNYFEKTFYFWFSGIIFGQLLVGIIGAIFLYINTSGHIDFNIKNVITIAKLRNLIDFFWPISLSATFVWLHFQSYRFIIESYLGAYDLGIFVAGFSIGLSLIVSAELILSSFLLPRFYKSIETSDDNMKTKAWSLYASTLIPSLFITGCIVTILAPELTKLFLGPEFQNAFQFVIWGVLCEICRVVFGAYSLMAHAKMKTNWLILPSLIGTLISISLSIYLLKIISIHAVGIAMFLAGIIAITYIHFYINSRILLNLRLKKIIYILIFSIILYIFDIFIRIILPFNNIYQHLFIVFIYFCIFMICQYHLLYKTIKNYDKS